MEHQSGTGSSTTGRTGERISRPPDVGNPVITGLFRDRNSAERAYDTLRSRGYTEDEINLIMSDETRQRHFSSTDQGQQTEFGNKAAEGAGVGGALGGTIGAVAASIAAVGTSVAIPGLGLVVAGPIAAALAGAGAGGAAGSLLGALVGWGIPEERVKQYEQGIREGGILMGVKPRSDRDAEELRREWEAGEGRQVQG